MKLKGPAKTKSRKRGAVRSNTQPQFARLHAIIRKAAEGSYPNRRTLAREFEITKRTVQRDLDYLRDVWKVNLQYDDLHHGFYLKDGTKKLPTIPLSEQEMVSIFVAQKALKQYHGTPFEEPLRRAFEKLAGSLEGAISVKWTDLESAISFRGIEPNIEDTKLLHKLGLAVRNQTELEFEYFKLDDPSRTGTQTGDSQPAADSSGHPQGELRRVQPYHLASIAGQWYLIAFDHLRNDIRKFVPTRMRNLRVLTKKFEKPDDFSVDDYLKGSFGVHSGGAKDLLQVKIWVARSRAQLMRERRWHHSQKVRELPKGEVEVSFQISNFVEIVPWILGWGTYARALEPPLLVEEIKRVVGELSREYGSVDSTSKAN